MENIGQIMQTPFTEKVITCGCTRLVGEMPCTYGCNWCEGNQWTKTKLTEFKIAKLDQFVAAQPQDTVIVHKCLKITAFQDKRGLIRYYQFVEAKGHAMI